MNKFSKINKLTITLIILFVVLFFGSAYFQRGKMLSLYQSGIDKLENQEYREAQEILSELGDYKDSIQYVKLSQVLENNFEIYDQAVDLFKNEDYEDAIKLFSQLDNFIFSQEYIKMANNIISTNEEIEKLYNCIVEYYNENNFILAIQKILELNNYIQNMQENFQNDFISDEHVEENQKIFRQDFGIEIALNDYSQNTQNDFENALQKLFNLDNYIDDEITIENCKVELARLQQATTISAGIRSSVGMIRNGKVYLAGDDYYSWKSELDTWNDIISISVKGNFVVGLKEDGTVVMAGKVPEYYVGTKTWNDVISISTGQQYIIGLRKDGTLVAQGHNGDDQVNIDKWHNIVAIATGWRHTVGLDSNGIIHITGLGSNKQLEYIEEHKDEWTNIVDIDAGGGTSGSIGSTAYTVALKQDGTVVTTLTGEIAEEIAKWEEIIAISAGDSHIVGLKSDGTVIATQTGNSTAEISQWSDIVSISAGYGFTLGLKSDGTVVATGYDHDGQVDVDSWKDITNYKEEWNSIFDENLRWNGME